MKIPTQFVRALKHDRAMCEEFDGLIREMRNEYQQKLQSADTDKDCFRNQGAVGAIDALREFVQQAMNMPNEVSSAEADNGRRRT